MIFVQCLFTDQGPSFNISHGLAVRSVNDQGIVDSPAGPLAHLRSEIEVCNLCWNAWPLMIPIIRQKPLFIHHFGSCESAEL